LDEGRLRRVHPAAPLIPNKTGDPAHPDHQLIQNKTLDPIHPPLQEVCLIQALVEHPTLDLEDSLIPALELEDFLIPALELEDSLIQAPVEYPTLNQLVPVDSLTLHQVELVPNRSEGEDL